MQLFAETRNVFGKKLRPFKKEGKLPAILYGAKTENTPLFVSLKDFEKLLKKAGESTVIELQLPRHRKSGQGAANVLIQDVALDPAKNNPVHVDFLAVEMDKPITAAVPFVFEGIAPAVKEMGGVLVKVMHEVELQAFPKDLPHEIKVDISKLATFEDKIYIKDIVLPAGVKITAHPDEAVVLAEAPAEQEIESAAEAPSIEDIEVEKKNKKTSEEESNEKV